jgi:hypothetical protein
MADDINPKLKHRPMLTRCLKAFIVLVFVNFAVYYVEVFVLQGDALNGRVQDGHYYLGFKGHLTEVSPTVFAWSWWHSVLTWLGFALAFCAIGWLAPPRPWVKTGWEPTQNPGWRSPAESKEKSTPRTPSS